MNRDTVLNPSPWTTRIRILTHISRLLSREPVLAQRLVITAPIPCGSRWCHGRRDDPRYTHTHTHARTHLSFSTGEFVLHIRVARVTGLKGNTKMCDAPAKRRRSRAFNGTGAEGRAMGPLPPYPPKKTSASPLARKGCSAAGL